MSRIPIRRTAPWLFVAASVILWFSAAQGSGPPEKVVTEANNGGSVTLKSGEVLEVRLKSQPGTGYKWYLNADPSPCLQQLEESVTTPDSPGVGRPVFQVFKFKGQKHGTVTLKLSYMRAWEKSKPPASSFEITASIQ
jgi:inhibitor of cysteine peptidase